MIICQAFILKVLERIETVKSLPWGDPETYNEFFLIETLKWYEEEVKELDKFYDKDCEEYKEKLDYNSQVARLLIHEFVYNCFDKENSYKFHDFIFGKRYFFMGPWDDSVIHRENVWGLQETLANRVEEEKRRKGIEGSLKRIPVKCMADINLLIPKFTGENIHFCSFIHLDNKVDKFGNWNTSVHFIADKDHINEDCLPDKAGWNTKDKIKYVEEELRSLQKWLEE